MMKDSEITAYNYLKYLGFQRIDYEPEGKSKPPDFLVDGRIAVEVRRLNQHETPLQSGTKPRGLEELAIPVWENIKRLLPSLGPPRGEASWSVSIKFKRPIPDRKQINDAVRQYLETFQGNPTQGQTSVRLFDNFELKLIRLGRPHPDKFVMGGCSDRDCGGWLIPELERNLKICINEKTSKISGIRAQYAEWWLVLIDQINYGTEEVIQLPSHDWDKIVLINPLDHTRALAFSRTGYS